MFRCLNVNMLLRYTTSYIYRPERKRMRKMKRNFLFEKKKKRERELCTSVAKWLVITAEELCLEWIIYLETTKFFNWENASPSCWVRWQWPKTDHTNWILYSSFRLNTNELLVDWMCWRWKKYRLNLAEVHNRTTEQSTTTHVYENTAVLQ